LQTLFPYTTLFRSGDLSSSESEGGAADGAEDADAAAGDDTIVACNDDVADEDLTEFDVSAINALEGRRVLVDFVTCGSHLGTLLKPLTPAESEGT
jgi:hypothetical protein